MNKMPTLSVMMTNYNYGRYIAEALEAILTQSFQPKEVILVDDASTDNSIEVINEFLNKYPNLKLFRNEKNMGPAFSANRALEFASCDYVYCAASDDKVLPGFFEKSINLLAKYPQAGISFSRVLTSDYQIYGQLYNGRPQYFSPEQVVKLFQPALCSFIPDHSAILKRHNLYEAGGFVPKMRWSCTIFTNSIIALRYGACYIPEILVWTRIHDQRYPKVNYNVPSERDVIVTMFDTIKKSKYKDVLASYRKASPFSHSPWLVLKIIVSNPKYWLFLSPKLFRLTVLRDIINKASFSWLILTFFFVLLGSVPISRFTVNILFMHINVFFVMSILCFILFFYTKIFNE